MELLELTLVVDLNNRLIIRASNNLEWPHLHIVLDNRIIELTTNKSFSIKDGVLGVSGNLILSGITNQPFGISKCHIRRCSSITLIIGYNLNGIILPDTNT
mmetsp:Transcript_18564/g.15857  ORF Transcript_18564/g.15857 Transcript_18564/m.15857 type:complete len:101 (-) Transcript_18564:452-754(-)